ncbi:MAG: ABC transporter ATP-binding protein [Clostridia bacterium]|nr:ABC transporter ATP-binding protein [Clostridia bacterium]
MKLEIDGVTKKYREKTAVNNLSVTLTDGIYALLGANGSGKTTLMRMIADVLQPDEGEIRLDGEKIQTLGAAYRNLIGYLPQNFGYYKDFTAEDFLFYFCAVKGINGRYRKTRTQELLKYVGLYNERKKKIKAFSGGMRQRLGIAEAMLNNPSVLILDEPTAGLDPKERLRFRGMVAELSRDRIIIYATHIVSDISFIADRVLVMKDGGIALQGTVKELTDSIKGRVWLVSAERKQLSSFQKRFIVGEIVHGENNMLSMRIVSAQKPAENAVPCEPDLNDVYLECFGEVSERESECKR